MTTPLNADSVSEELKRITAKEIWAYNECPWDFDNPPEGMAKLQKQIAMDEAERILNVIAPRLKAEDLREVIAMAKEMYPDVDTIWGDVLRPRYLTVADLIQAIEAKVAAISPPEPKP